MPTATRHYKLGAVKPGVQAAADEMGNLFNFAVIGGYRAVGSVPNSDHPKGLALDFMTFDKNKAENLIQYAQSNAARLGITYIIYWRRIWYPGKGWKAYDGPNPHIDHVHISFADGGGDSTAPITGVTSPVSMFDPKSWPVIKQIEGIADALQDPVRWQRVGMYFLGLCLISAGLFFLFKNPIVDTATRAASVVK